MTDGKGIRMTVVAAVAAAALATGWADDAAAGDRAGFFGGMNIANMGGDMERLGEDFAAELEAEIGGNWSSSKSSDTGFGAGAYYYLARSPNFGFQFEVQYVRRGVKFGLGIQELDLEAAFRNDYVEFPLLLRYMPGAEEDRLFVLMLGPVVGFNVSSELEVSGEGASETTDASDSFASTTVGALAAAGLQASLGEATAFLLQVRYYHGLTDALDTEGYSSRSRDVGFFAGLEFALGR